MKHYSHNNCAITKEAIDLVDQEIQDLFMKRAIVVSLGATRIFSIFLLMLLPGDKMCDIDMKNAYFEIPLSVKSRTYVRFQWKDRLYEFCCFFFGISPAPMVFTKLLKVYLSLERAQCKNNNYLDSMLLIASSLEDLLMVRDTLIFILQHLEFLINMKKSYLEPKSISSSSKTPPLSSSSVSTDSEVNLSQLFWGESDNFGGGKKKTIIVERKLASLQWEIFNFSPTSNKNKLRWLITRLGSELSHKCLGAQGSQISYNVLHIKGKRCNISSHPHGQHGSLVIHNKNGGYWKTKRKPEETGFSLADITN